MPQPSNSVDTAPIEEKSIGRDGILELLEAPDETPETIPLETEKKVETKEVDDDKDEKEDGKEDEIKLEDEEDEPSYDEDEIEIIAPARRQEILKAYPDLFKKFPHLEKSYYRDQKYSELFGTPEEAKTVVENARALESYQSNLFRGDTKQILSAVKEQNPEAFAKIVDGYITSLKDVDERAFYHVISNFTKSTAAAMAQEAQRLGNDDLLNAARMMYQYMMGTTEYTPPKSFGKERPKEEVQQESELSKERMQFFQERFETIQSDLQSRVDGVLKNTIDQNIDPKNSMTGYVKKVAVNEVMTNVQKAIDSDPSFRKLIDRLWEKAADDKFSKNSIEKIRSAYLSKAKTLLPTEIKKSRNDALRGLGKRVREDVEEPVKETKRATTSAPATIRGSNSKENPSKGKSTYDFLNED